MQTEINSALQVAFSRHLLLAVPPPYSSPFSTPSADNDAVRRAVISESPYKQGKNYREGKAPKRRLSSSNLLTAPDLLGVRKLETN